MVVNHDPALLRVTVHALAALVLGELEAIALEGADDVTDRNVPEQPDRRVLHAHTVTATAGSRITSRVASRGTSSPAFCMSRT